MIYDMLMNIAQYCLQTIQYIAQLFNITPRRSIILCNNAQYYWASRGTSRHDSPKMKFNSVPPSTKLLRPIFFFLSFLYRVGHPLITFRRDTFLHKLPNKYHICLNLIHCQNVEQTGEQLIRRIQAKCYSGTCNDSTNWAICLSQRITSKFTKKLNMMSLPTIRHDDDDDNNTDNNSSKSKVSLSIL